MWVLNVLAVLPKRLYAEFCRVLTDLYRLSGVVMYWLLFWARTWGALPGWAMLRRRLTSLTNHNHLSMDACCVSLVQRRRSETWPTLPSQHLKHLVGCCRASWAHVVQRVVRSRAKPSMMHVEGSTALKIEAPEEIAMAVLHCIEHSLR